MASRLPSLVKKFGYLNGIKLYYHIKFKSKAPISIPGLKHPIHFRGVMADVYMFEQIFVDDQYKIEVPFGPKVIIDLGANVGFASIYFANRFPDAKILAVEPDAGNYEAAKRNTAAYSNITLIQGAVWHTTESINVIDSGHGEAAYMIEKGEGKNMVKAYTLKDIMEMMKVSSIDILKIDIEGAEKEIFETGAEAWVPVSKLIIVETHDRYKKGTSKAVFNTISRYDFSLEVSGENLAFYNNDLVKAFQ
jgi:FkbM family methyltransferase